MVENINVVGLEVWISNEHLLAYGGGIIFLIISCVSGKSVSKLVGRIPKIISDICLFLVLILVSIVFNFLYLSKEFGFVQEQQLESPAVWVTEGEFEEIESTLLPRKTYYFSTGEYEFYPESMDEIYVGEYDGMEKGACYRIWYDKRSKVLLKLEKIESIGDSTPRKVENFVIVDNIE